MPDPRASENVWKPGIAVEPIQSLYWSGSVSLDWEPPKEVDPGAFVRAVGEEMDRFEVDFSLECVRMACGRRLTVGRAEEVLKNQRRCGRRLNRRERRVWRTRRRSVRWPRAAWGGVAARVLEEGARA